MLRLKLIDVRPPTLLTIGSKRRDQDLKRPVVQPGGAASTDRQPVPASRQANPIDRNWAPMLLVNLRIPNLAWHHRRICLSPLLGVAQLSKLNSVQLPRPKSRRPGTVASARAFLNKEDCFLEILTNYLNFILDDNDSHLQ
jgi:hypothetical protein